jgi:hypothetical protein
MSAGIFITQIGVSVPTAADYQFVFNSNWPSLACAYDNLVTIGAGASMTLPHNLGFPPFTQGFLIQNGVSMGRIFAQSESFEGYQSNVTLSFDKTNVYLTNNDTVSWTVDVKCYNLDVTQQANYNLPTYPTFTKVYDPSVGIKVSKFNKGITSTDLRDFILHSRAQSPATLAVVTGNSPLVTGATQGEIIYVNPAATAIVSNTAVPYIPWTFAFYSLDGNIYTGLAPGNQQTGVLFSLSQDILNFITGSSNPGALLNISSLYSSYPNANGSLVVLRDPLLVPSNAQVNYTGSPISG